MLVLSRKANEQILIGDDIKITLVRIRGGSVRIGIDAPREVRVVRSELKSFDSVSTSAKSRSSSKDGTNLEVDPVAEVFAHPEAVLKQTKKKSRAESDRRSVASRIATMVGAPESEASSPNEKVKPMDNKSHKEQLNRAPLSSYMSAS